MYFAIVHVASGQFSIAVFSETTYPGIQNFLHAGFSWHTTEHSLLRSSTCQLTVHISDCMFILMVSIVNMLDEFNHQKIWQVWMILIIREFGKVYTFSAEI